MATLRYSQIRITPGGTIRYIADEEKNISTTVHDVCTVLRYMGEPESTERVYAIARYCSTNPALAEKQMELYRQLYYDRKERKPKEEELLGLHFFISYTEEDDPSEEVMNIILRKLLEQQYGKMMHK